MLHRLTYAAFAVLLLLPVLVAQQEPTEESVRQQIARDLPDNMNREISPADVRGALLGVVDIIPTEVDIRGYIAPWAWNMGGSGVIPTPRLAAGGSAGDFLRRTATSHGWESVTIPDAPATWAASGFTGTIPDARIPNLNASKITAGVLSHDRLAGGYVGSGAVMMSAATRTGSPSWQYIQGTDIRGGTIADARLPASIARDTELPAAPATWAQASGATGRIPFGTLPLCTMGQVLKFGTTTWACGSDAVGAGGGIDQNTAIGLIATWALRTSPTGTIPDARIPASIARDTELPDAPASWAFHTSPTGTIPLARFLSGGNTGDLVQRTSTGFQWASQANAVDLRVESWARSNSPTGTVPANRIDNALARDNEMIAALLIGNTATSRGAVLVSAGPSTSTERSRTQYAWQDIMDDSFVIQGSSIDNAITRDAEIPDALFAAAPRGFGTAVAGDCLIATGNTRTGMDWQPCPTGSGGGATSTFSAFTFSMAATNISAAAGQVTIAGSAQNGLSVASGCVSVGSAGAGHYHLYAKADFVPNRTEPPGTVGPNRNFPDIILRRTRSSTNTDTTIRTPYIRGFHDGQSPARMTEALAWFIQDAQDGDSYCLRLDASQASAHQADFLAVSNGELTLISLP